MGDSLRLSLLI
ncbi:unnamed protein product [Linum tenue]|uniref:Uncharacterized protein n=1 Tax=Linum tenue TaxID=586396 RepID=A0AAV0JMX4_9ROSI|nr:unnamed protein product [Linum tenue]